MGEAHLLGLHYNLCWPIPIAMGAFVVRTSAVCKDGERFVAPHTGFQ